MASIAGRFQTLADWAGVTHADYYEIVLSREGERLDAGVGVYEPYYRSMAFRLAVLGGAGGTPANTTSVVTLADHTDARGFASAKSSSQRAFPVYEAALAVAMAERSPAVRLAGLDPWQAAFPLAPIQGLGQVHQVRTPGQKPGESPWVRIFQLR